MVQFVQKEILVQIAVSELKQHVHLLDEAKVEDIEVTKRGRPFVVVVDAGRYQKLIANSKDKKMEEKTFDDALKEATGLMKGIKDPVAWQRALREEEDRDIYAEMGL